MSLRALIQLATAVVATGVLHAAPAPAPAPNAARTGAPRIETGPALGWTLPLFTDKEGYHLLTLRGDEARLLGPDRIEVKGFTAIVFSGDASEHVDTILLSPEATFYPQENRAAGPGPVRLLFSGRNPSDQDDIEVIGRGWTYDHRSKKVSIAHDARVTFHAQLNDILK